MGFRLTEKELAEHPTQSRSGRHATDRELRRLGFVILHRPKDQEPIWKRGSVICNQSAAEEWADRLKKEGELC